MLKNCLLITEDSYVVHNLLIDAQHTYKFSINNELFFNIKKFKYANPRFKYDFKK